MGCAMALGVGWPLIRAAIAIPSFSAIQKARPSSDALFVDRHGLPLQTLRVDLQARRLPWSSLGELPESLRRATIIAEDQRFYQHHGVDWRAFAGAAWRRFRGEQSRGASTISMQVAAQLLPHLQSAGARRSLWQKWQQLWAAWVLEQRLTKQQILEIYLNTVTFRGELQGIAAATANIWQKAAADLTPAQALVLAVLIREPGATRSELQRRAQALAERTRLTASPNELRQSIDEVLTRAPLRLASTGIAPQAARRLLHRLSPTPSERDRLEMTLDGKLQGRVQELLEQQLQRLEARHVRDGAVLVVENASGEVLAYVANRGEAASAHHIDGVNAQRQAGSTLKPFLYELALERRLLTAVSLLDDSPIELAVGNGVYRPRNYDSIFRGPVSVRTALASSLNVPAVRALGLVGVDAMVRRLTALGFTELERADFYGPSLALGAIDVSLWHLVNAYRTLANGGHHTALRLGKAEPPRSPVQVMEPGASFIITDILADRGSRSATFGLDSILATRFFTAVKTGTSKDMRDNWCVGFSDRYTVGVWVGNFDGTPMWNVSGMAGAAPVWLDVMNHLHRQHVSVAPPAPEGVQRTTVRAHNGIPVGDDWFLAGTEVARLVRVDATAAKILYPSDGLMIALDPDIPGHRQRVPFEASLPEGQGAFVLDGAYLGPSDERWLWHPIRGEHRLELLDNQGHCRDQVKFSVR